MEYIFNISTLDSDLWLGQVSQALEKRTELISRKECPRLWERTDKLNNRKKVSQAVSKHRKKRRKVHYIIDVLLGIFMVSVYCADQEKLGVLLIVGIFQIVIGGLGLFLTRKYKKDYFSNPAKLIMDETNLVLAEKIQVVFTDKEMRLNPLMGDTQTMTQKVVPYSEFEYMIQTKDIFLLTYHDCAIILQKKDLDGGNIEDFCNYIPTKFG